MPPSKTSESVKQAPHTRVFHTLDALRGIAAVGVVVFHFGGVFAPIAAPGGYLAVDIFFMMSGVVLSHAYETRFRAGMGAIDFMRARLIRLYPLYILGTVFGIAVTLASLYGRNIANWDPWSLLRAALLAPFFLPNLSTKPVDELFPLNIPCWSLFFELLVNLLFVVSWRWLNSRRLLALSLLAGVAVGLAIMHDGSIDQGSNPAGFGIGLARTIFGFSVGVLIARHIPRAVRIDSNLGVLAVVTAAAIAITARPNGAMGSLWDATCVLMVFPLLVYLGTLVDPVSRMRKISTFLGVTSYAIYVLHSPLSAIVNSATRQHSLGSPEHVGAPYLGIAVLLALSTGCWLVDRYFDMPVRRRLNRILPMSQASRTVKADGRV